MLRSTLPHQLNSVKMPRKIAMSTPPRYHHGDLRAALIRATDEILVEVGVNGFTLREAARRAGVSAAAPAHHFGSSAGLLSEVAALGFEQLTEYLQVPAGRTPTQRLRKQGLAYVRFALDHPGRFELMFRHHLLNPEHEVLKAAGDRAMQQLEDTIRAIRKIPSGKSLKPVDRAAMLAVWSMVHGFAHLALDGKMAHLEAGASHQDLLAKLLPSILESQWPDPS
jgi:AcrR family transcriptional regulator